MQGTITYFNNAKGYGFITVPPNGDQFFFHVKNCMQGHLPVLGGVVRFDVAPPISIGKRAQAVSVHYPQQTVPTPQVAIGAERILAAADLTVEEEVKS
jgi:cold shock CspA family protein